MSNKIDVIWLIFINDEKTIKYELVVPVIKLIEHKFSLNVIKREAKLYYSDRKKNNEKKDIFDRLGDIFWTNITMEFNSDIHNCVYASKVYIYC